MHTDAKLTRTIICPHNPSQSSTGSPGIDLIWLSNRLGFISNCYELENLEVWNASKQGMSRKDPIPQGADLFRRGKHVEIYFDCYRLL